ncbi:esterase-like activity of phytase family protein [Pseudoduganella ginsengisoli]|uniref:Esterase-like activity of phytase family protein n=1 Tax=Pseudoduganella ginsengisoli TaxID=1462440 RepID=A0A6L6PZX6_9BURK|nr:esterase-like activity of phytase family protein [Pseudoduganella ginsengisoli]MTW03127.1 esterase-like activity of phytase family protein [Pseudoduganella ginsengisoli]
MSLPSFHSRLAVCAIALAAILTACGGGEPDRSVGSLKLLGEQRIPLKMAFKGSVVGGLSGIDYDPNSGNWVLISDDRSELSPARFYTARLNFGLEGFSSVELRDVVYLRQADGSLYPSRAQYALRGGEVADAESVRFDPRDGSIWWSSEGDRSLGLQPFVRHTSADGGTLQSLPTPYMFSMSAAQTQGARMNLSYEAMSFSADGKSLWVAMEGPVYADGAPATATSGALSRITRYDLTGTMMAQFAYPIEAAPGATPSSGAAENGISEILAIDSHRMLVLERAAVQPAPGQALQFHARIYEIDTDGATDTSRQASLAGAYFKPVPKRLVLDLNALGIKVDCIEGMAWGPRLANGHLSIVLVSDDNFDAFGAGQVTQLLAFEVLPK